MQSYQIERTHTHPHIHTLSHTNTLPDIKIIVFFCTGDNILFSKYPNRIEIESRELIAQ